MNTNVKEDVMLRKMFADAVAEPNFVGQARKEPEIFHETLALAQARDWVQPSALAEEMGLPVTPVAEWFKTARDPGPRSTPDASTMEKAFTASRQVIMRNVARLENR